MPGDTLKLTAARRRVLEALKDGPAMAAAELAHLAGVGTSVIKAMAAAGLLDAVRAHRAPVLSAARWRARRARRCRRRRRRAADGLIEKVKAHAFSATLLDGVPGAGKTEVYFEAIAAALAMGRQVLVLLPEIALTAQWLKRFEDRFGWRDVSRVLVRPGALASFRRLERMAGSHPELSFEKLLSREQPVRTG